MADDAYNQPSHLGLLLCYLYLCNVKCFKWNHKCVYSIYKDLLRNLQIKLRKFLLREMPKALALPQGICQVRTINFMHDQLGEGRTFRLFNVSDNIIGKRLEWKCTFFMPSERVNQDLKQIISWCGKPVMIRSDNVRKYINSAFQHYAADWGIRLLYIQPGNLYQNDYLSVSTEIYGSRLYRSTIGISWLKSMTLQ